MTRLDQINDSLLKGKDSFLLISPGVPAVIKPKRIKRIIGIVFGSVKIVRRRRRGDSYRNISIDFLAKPISGKLTGPILRPVRRRMVYAYVWASRHSGPGLTIGSKPDAKGEGRSWITEPGRYTMVIVYHDADRAGAHIDCHIGHLSLIYRVKPELKAKLKFGSNGALTAASKELLITHVRAEVENGARVPQNLDHPNDQATYAWLGHDNGPQGYGAGTSRQVVSESTVEVFKTIQGGPIEFYAPVINPHHASYIYQIYPGSDNRSTPICIWGLKIAKPPAVEDRLHLRMLDPQRLPVMAPKLDMASSTAKYDGSSVYLHVSSKGTTAWSPRVSKRSGHRIEYTPKINSIAGVHSDESIVAMGELMFYRIGRGGKKIFLDHATSGGLLNSHNLLPEDVHPIVVVYRIDRIGRTKTLGLPFWDQRQLIEERVVKLDPEHFMMPELLSPAQAKRRNFEGVVICKPGESVLTGYKTKYWQDADDWVVDSVEFEYSSKGNVAGVVWFTSLESGKQFKLGPGSVGDRALCEHMMQHPELYTGAVVKVRSRHGHEGRAAKMLEFHPDKGLAPF